MEISIKYFSYFLIYLTILIASVNCIIEVIKDLFFLKPYPTKWVTTILSIIITLISVLWLMSQYGIIITWYIIVAAIILGFYVAYGAINGFDKLYGKYLDKIKSILLSSITSQKGEK